MKKSKAKLNGIQKTSPVFLWISSLSRPGIRSGLLQTLSAIFKKFFFYQFQTRLFPKTRPVVNVDHPLDRNIPFDPSWVGLYNTFTVFWMKSAGWLLKTFGEVVEDDVAEFTREMALLYNSAGEIYNRCQSTTDRPGVTPDINFIIIHIFDPHLHCVPSLHVMVCAYTAWKTAEIMGKHSGEQDLYLEESLWVFKNAVEIIESVLLVKQHSVNCIPAGYYMNSVLFEGFRKDWAGKFMREMFRDDPKGISEIDKITTYIMELYDRFITGFDESGDRNSVILDFLHGYEVKKKTAETEEVGLG